MLTIDAEPKTFVNVLDVSTATLRLKKDAKIKGQLSYAELTPAGLLYISQPDATVNEVEPLHCVNSLRQVVWDTGSFWIFPNSILDY